MITARQILAEIDEPCLKLYPGKGYWYFVFDSGDYYNDKSVPVMRLGDLPLTDWVADGKTYAADMRAKLAEIRARPDSGYSKRKK